MKKVLLGLVCSVVLSTVSGLTANAADTTGDQTAKSTGKVGFEPGSITIDNGDKDLQAASLDFGSNKIEDTNVDSNYDNTNKDAAVSVQDLRGTAAGWELRVKQEGVFKNTAAAANEELTGAILTLNGVLNAAASTTGADATVMSSVPLKTIGSDAILMNAALGKGNGKNVANISTSQLMVPHTTARAQGSYTTTLIWSLTGAPVNR